mmetsp:Transcript_66767/g.164560  ORF Transcript_66767/g.164560 Transcript_66767/m.164560 type:complete len:224 (-) Transcript_66767:26-697(-)
MEPGSSRMTQTCMEEPVLGCTSSHTAVPASPSARDFAMLASSSATDCSTFVLTLVTLASIPALSCCSRRPSIETIVSPKARRQVRAAGPSGAMLRILSRPSFVTPNSQPMQSEAPMATGRSLPPPPLRMSSCRKLCVKPFRIMLVCDLTSLEACCAALEACAVASSAPFLMALPASVALSPIAWKGLMPHIWWGLLAGASVRPAVDVRSASGWMSLRPWLAAV